MSTGPDGSRVSVVRSLNALSIVGIFGGFLLVLNAKDSGELFGVYPRVAMLAAFALIGLAALWLLYQYVSGRISIPIFDRLVPAPENSSSFAEASAMRRATALNALVDEAERRVEELKTRVDIQARELVSAASVVDHDKLLESLRSSVGQSLAADVEARIESRVKEQLPDREMREALNMASRRLFIEIGSLTRRGNVNLLIGVGTTVSAVTVLVYLATQAQSLEHASWDWVARNAPRISIAVFIEVFSFFFLRLYRDSLNEIKYYQNELTTLDAKRVALEAARSLGTDDTARSAIVVDIAKTDRNRATALVQRTESVTLKEAADVVEQLGKITASVLRRSEPEKAEK